MKKRTVKLISSTRLISKYGSFRLYLFREITGKKQHIALAKGRIKKAKDLNVRIHSRCITGDTLGSIECDCRNQMVKALKFINKKGRGLFVYLDQEGRDIGLENKIKALHLQEKGLDTVEANEKLGLPADKRDYQAAAEIIKYFKPYTVVLMTNNPKKVSDLSSSGVRVAERKPIRVKSTKYTKKYLDTKKKKLGHIL